MRSSLFILCFFLSLYSCSGKTPSENKMQATLSIKRFDKDFFQYLKNPTADNQRKLQVSYPHFLPVFGRVAINNSDSYKDEFYLKLQKYFSNELLLKIYNDALVKYDDVTSYEAELSEVDRLIGENFAGSKLPALYMHVSGFKENILVTADLISISIDKYLGQNYPPYLQFFEDYQRIQMQPQMVVRDYIKAWLLSSEIIPEPKTKNLLEQIIKEGKVLYTLSVLLPNNTEGDLIAYTPEQLNWCEENQKDIWKTIIKNNHLYEQDYQLINKYVNESPYTAPLNSGSPGRVGTWVGWKIVSAYMSKHKVSLKQLMEIDGQQLLKNSGYNP